MKPSGFTLYRNVIAPTFLLVFMGTSVVIPFTHAGNIKSISTEKAEIVKLWTKERRNNAIPRELVIDQNGLGYMKKPDGSFVPYGQQVSRQAPVPFGKPSTGDGGDTTPPIITDMNPAEGDTINGSHTFSTTVSDPSGIKSVSFVIGLPSGTTQTFTAGRAAQGDTWEVDLQNFTNGSWSWWVQAKDGAGKGGNSGTSAEVSFFVDTAGTGGGGDTSGSDTIINKAWDVNSAILNATGRIYFEMPANAKRKGPWNGYVCSGTVVNDGTEDRSVILTAAHCVYDDVNQAFARNVMFIPNQAATTASATDLDCSNDIFGCWVPSYGVVDDNWTTSIFPDNIPWDYAYYVVNNVGAHAGTGNTNELDAAAGSLEINFDNPNVDDGVAGAETLDFTHAFGYSYSDDPYLMYCAEDMTTVGVDNWWLPSCGLSGGASGGPWAQPDITSGSDLIISVNSWGYTTQPGMAGPKLDDSSAECLFSTARYAEFPLELVPDGDAGIVEYCL